LKSIFHEQECDIFCYTYVDLIKHKHLKNMTITSLIPMEAVEIHHCSFFQYALTWVNFQNCISTLLHHLCLLKCEDYI
jgi:hypothetical protein